MFCVALGIFSSRGPLERLTIGLAKEISIWQECNDTLLYVERREFLTAMRDAHSGLYSELGVCDPERKAESYQRAMMFASSNSLICISWTKYRRKIQAGGVGWQPPTLPALR